LARWGTNVLSDLLTIGDEIFMIPKDFNFLGTFYIYLARCNVIPKKKVGLANSLKRECKPLRNLVNAWKNENDWSAAAAGTLKFIFHLFLTPESSIGFFNTTGKKAIRNLVALI
jgi:hypothetical protein